MRPRDVASDGIREVLHWKVEEKERGKKSQPLQFISKETWILENETAELNRCRFGSRMQAS